MIPYPKVYSYLSGRVWILKRTLSVKSIMLDKMKMKHYSMHGNGCGNKTIMKTQGVSGAEFEIISDGSNEESPTPVELVLASLCGCEQATAMYIARLDVRSFWSSTTGCLCLILLSL